jgi:hypothetical protein
MALSDQVWTFLSFLGLQLAASVPVLTALAAALLARGWLAAFLFGLIGYVLSTILHPAVLGLVTGAPELALFGLVGLQRGGFTLQVLATVTQFVAITLLIYWAVRRRRAGEMVRGGEVVRS